MNRRQFLTAGIGSLIAAQGWLNRALAASVTPKVEGELAWYNVQDWGVEGKGWKDTEKFYDRLPARAKATVRPAVWSLSRNSAGMLTRFETDAQTIHVRYKLSSERVAMPHMPATGVSGVDLYAANDKGIWRWLACAKPEKRDVNAQLITGLAPGRRAYTAYLPLYNGIETLEFGVPAKSAFAPIAPRTERPILFYGTSITHGASAMRPGMPHPAILGRRFNRPVINLGFSGNGLMEPEVGALLAELDPCVYVIDCLPNMQAPLVAERAEPLVRQLRRARPLTPIVLVEDRTYANAPFLPKQQERHATSRAEFKKAYDRLKSSGVRDLYYIKGETLLGDDYEATVDSSHPTDLGFMRQADAMEPVLRKALKRG
ncbi:MAG: SGNH/GDSL hydrolase family protein [Verrucomicrobiota bacterium]